MVFKIVLGVLCLAFVALNCIAAMKKGDSVFRN